MKRAIAIILGIMIIMCTTVPAAAFSSIPVKSIKLDTVKVTLKVGEVFTPKVIFAPSNTTQTRLVYVTNNKNVAKIDATGKIIAVKPGTTVITIRSYYKKTVLAKCTVTVISAVAKDSTPAYMNATGFPIAKKKIVIKAMGAKGAVQGPWEDMTLIKEMERLTNVSFEFNTYDGSIYQEKKNLALASGDVPDIFLGSGLSIDDEEIYGPQKLLIPLEGLIDKYAPHLKARLNEDPTTRNGTTATDGHIYGLPYVARTRTTAASILYVNMQWLKNVGMQKPTTVEQLYDVMKAFKEKDPNGNGKADEIPVSVYSSSGSMLGVLGSAILSAFSGQAGGTGFDLKDGKKVIYNPAQPYYKDFLEYMRKLYKEGLLDNEIFTQTSQNLYAKGKEGKLGVLTVSLSLVLNPAKHDDHELLPPLTSALNNKKVTAKLYGITPACFGITKKCKYPEAMMRWVDILYRTSDEEIEGLSGLSVFIGKHGVNWDYSDSEKTKYLRKSLDPAMTPVEYTNKCVSPGASSGFPSWVVTDAVPDGDPLLLLKATESAKHYFPYMVPVYPTTVRYSKSDAERVKFLSNDIRSYMDQMTAKFVTGEEPLSNFDAYVNNLKKMNLDELTKIMQTAYDKWSKAK